jgi:hypothetical protein
MKCMDHDTEIHVLYLGLDYDNTKGSAAFFPGTLPPPWASQCSRILSRKALTRRTTSDIEPIFTSPSHVS